MSDFDPNAIITAVLGAGGIAFIGALVKAFKDLRAGAQARDRDTVGSLREQRDEAERNARESRRDCDHYHLVAGRLAYQLERAGLTPDPGPDGFDPPSEREPEPAPPPAQRRARRANTT